MKLNITVLQERTGGRGLQELIGGRGLGNMKGHTSSGPLCFGCIAGVRAVAKKKNITMMVIILFIIAPNASQVSSILMAFINWAPEKTGFEKRVQRFVDIAREAGETGDTRIMDETSFRTLVKIQFAIHHHCIQRVARGRQASARRIGDYRIRSTFIPRVPLRRVVDLLVRSVARGWSSTHPVVQLVLQNLDFLPGDLEVEVGAKIPLMQKAWRRSGMDVVTIGSVLIALQSMFPQRFDRIMCMWRGWRIERGGAGSPAPPRDAGSSARAGAGEGRGSTSGSAG